MVKIPEITITDDTGFFNGKKFLWPNIGFFSIIAGVNSSGKTKILEYITNSPQFNLDALIRYIDVQYQPPSQKYANEFANGYNSSLFNKDGEYFEVGKDGRRIDRVGNLVHFKNNDIIKNIDCAIIDNIVKDRKSFQKNTIALRKELDRTESYLSTFDIKDLLPVNKNDDQPWDRVDRILSEFNLLIRVDRMNLVAGLEFLRRSKSGSEETPLEMKALCSGEKLAFALALWTWGNFRGQKTDILLVDEFDAHLNPSIVEKYISIIKEYFVDLGVQVIMTTHGASTIAYAKNAGADILWMEDGIIDFEMSYDNIIRLLSNGLIDINYLTEEIHLLIENRLKCVIYTEGKTDKKHIDSAIVSLNRINDFKDHFVFGCTGADTIPFFICLQTGQHRRIVLLDSDKKGKMVYEKITNNPNLKELIDKGKLKIVFVSSDDDQVIEDLFAIELRLNRNKEKFASHMALPVNQTATNFANFTTLLNNLE